MIYLDTHVVIYLYLGSVDKLGTGARKAIESEQLLVSPAAVLELQFLHEIGRLRKDAEQVIDTLAQDVGLRICDLPFRTVVDQALRESWGRDPFDRLIVANAKANGAPLITKDERIHQHYKHAVW